MALLTTKISSRIEQKLQTRPQGAGSALRFQAVFPHPLSEAARASVGTGTNATPRSSASKTKPSSAAKAS